MNDILFAPPLAVSGCYSKIEILPLMFLNTLFRYELGNRIELITTGDRADIDFALTISIKKFEKFSLGIHDL